ncbi:MAG TPA: hypothetical protein VMT03_21350 [Polyangia bacterium]|nr:hypothetical protein [Polyangia bacterium]
MTTVVKRLLIGALFAASISCGSSGGGGAGNSSGVPRSSTIASLTTTQSATLCDWEDAKQGGYGRTVTCTDGSTRTTDTNQAECIAGMGYAKTLCPTLTVADVEDCANAIGANLCEISTDPACANLAACLGY